MTWYAWLMIVNIAVNVCATWYWVGKPRRSLTEGDAFVITLLSALLTWGIIALAHS